MTRKEYLEQVIRQLQRPEHGEIDIEFRPGTGWLLTDESRAIGDTGEDVMGRNWKEAEQGLRWFLGDSPAPQEKAAR